MEGEAPFIQEGKGKRRSSSFSGVVGTFTGISRPNLKGGEGEEENSVEEEGSDAQSNQPVSHQSEASLSAIMHQMTQIMASLQAASSSEASRPPSFKSLSMKAPDLFVGTQPSKVRGFTQYSQLIFHNDQANFSEDRNKVLYSTLFLIGRA
ncbi:hypothetical protein O181_054044 [Austropuccinia psidii MF-1]|uniref:Uncharacterized protein n=1 Tax=Austropuccinia psidii MF-1 TaxID=1389203 RepID=A0A9Q3HT93_9BASI|nr:hypothetical protein [Austropuccinia psidii MF-1]